MKVVCHDRIPPQPWAIEHAPVEIKVKGRRIEDWTLENQTVEDLRVSPINSDMPDVELTLIPLGCARLRISCFPVIGQGMDAVRWKDACKSYRMDRHFCDKGE
jgi:hypothetical protein